ncbi:MAG: hypothetical protein AB1393_11025 [Candidatus Edwardsbacteria bacterium]
MKREIPLAITAITGILIVVTFFIPHQPFGGIQQRLLFWYSIVLGFTYLLGINSLVGSHLKKVQARHSGWESSIILLGGFLITLVTGIVSWIQFGTPFLLGSSFMYVYTYMIIPLQATMFALLSFFIASAAYRAFRARTFEATLLLIAAAIVMIGRVPIGAKIWSGLPVIADWIMDIPQMAAKRGIFLGVALGSIAMSLRVIIGLERTYLS